MSAIIAKLEIANAFKLLTLREKMYAYHMSNAAWAGARIIMKQRSPDSVEIFDFLLDVFRNRQNLMTSHMLPGQWEAFMDYTAQILGNLGNYHGHSGNKIIPNLPMDVIKTMVPDGDLRKRFDELCRVMYSPEPKKLGFRTEGGMTTYYSLEITKEDADKSHRFIAKHGICAENTRLIKHVDGSFIITVAAITQKQLPPVEFEGDKYTLLYGDYSKELIEINKHLAQAYKRAATNQQRDMIKGYMQSFETGSIEAHKNAQRHWVRDRSPAVETIVGFIETYEDPAGTRAEFELMVAIVDKSTSARFQELVLQAPKLIATLPWPREFEKDTFTSPDFTSINVLTFATSCIPAGINLPNYDDVRNEGFKNVSLSNIIYSTSSSSPFIPENLQGSYRKFRNISFEIGVGIHELLGHGSGKLIYEKDLLVGPPDKQTQLMNPLTGAPVETWYNPGETYSGKFGSLCNPCEECRAECVNLYLSVHPSIPEIFKINPQDTKDVLFINWYNMCYSGLSGLENYSEGKWQQAHCQARYVILQVLMEAGHGFITITESGPDNLELNIDPTQIITVGIPAISQLLAYLNIYKATANVSGMTAMFEKYSKVHGKFIGYREIILSKKKSRSIFVQPNIVLYQNGAKLIEYPATPEGMIQSFLDRMN